MATVRVIIVRAPGTNCDLEAQHAWECAGAAADRVHIAELRAAPRRLLDYQLLTIPGGFSYGDDISAGRIFAAQLERHLSDPLREFIDKGRLVLGICNGFQVLVKLGLLPFRGPHGRIVCTLSHNEPAGFQDRWVALRSEVDHCPFLVPGRVYEMPIAHGEGRVVFADDAARQRATTGSREGLTRDWVPLSSGTPLRDRVPLSSGTPLRDRVPLSSGTPLDSAGAPHVALRYLQPPNAAETPGGPANPNGSELDAAGLCDATGRVLGLMPHPERFVRATQHPCWTSRGADGPGDGLAVFQAAVRALR